MQSWLLCILLNISCWLFFFVFCFFFLFCLLEDSFCLFVFDSFCLFVFVSRGSVKKLHHKRCTRCCCRDLAQIGHWCCNKVIHLTTRSYCARSQWLLKVFWGWGVDVCLQPGKKKRRKKKTKPDAEEGTRLNGSRLLLYLEQWWH